MQAETQRLANEVLARPILFSGPMIRAILENRKSQTRRVLKPQPPNDVRRALNHPDDLPFVAFLRNGEDFWRIKCPYGRPGDRLWVRETWCKVDNREFGGDIWIDYRATPWESAEHPAGWNNAPDDSEALKWRPSIHMPRWASRITLEVTDVRVEKLQDISEEDAQAEGVTPTPDDIPFYGPHKDAFCVLWDSINASRGYSWQSNPWVWSVSFTRCIE